MDSFGSHVVRTLLSTLSPDNDEARNSSHGAAGRSKKSAAFKARQGSMKAVVAKEHLTQPGLACNTPARLKALAKKMVENLRATLSDNEIRALASDKVASPTLQIMLRVEAESGGSGRPGSLMDRVLMGMITRLGMVTTSLS